jgi:poly-gamma-glutamate capsule biosynthesis protein CapA/YwtB (metallophosphatase superfamily)
MPETSDNAPPPTLMQRRSASVLMLVVSLVGVGVLGVEFRNRTLAADVVAVAVLTETIVAETTVPPSTTVPPTTTTTTEPPPPPRRSAVLAFTGDTLAHRGVVAQAGANAANDEDVEAEYDFAPMFDLVRGTLTEADLAICHLETPLSSDNTSLSGYPTFNVPREMADALAGAGYDGCTTASNHSLDRRAEGVVSTLGVLDEAGLLHSGSARDQTEYDEPTIYDAGGISVASLSYSYGFNGFSEPADSPWLVNEIDVEEITSEVAAARSNGAEYVVLSLHWGTEYRHQPDAYQLDQAEQIAAIDGVDIVIGHHAHVVQPVDIVDDLPVVFGLGNFLSNQSAGCCARGAQDGVIMQVNIQELAPESGPGFRTWLTYVPTRVDRTDYSIVPLVDVLAGNALDQVDRGVFEASRERTAEALTLRGNTAGLRETR